MLTANAIEIPTSILDASAALANGEVDRVDLGSLVKEWDEFRTDSGSGRVAVLGQPDGETKWVYGRSDRIADLLYKQESGPAVHLSERMQTTPRGIFGELGDLALLGVSSPELTASDKVTILAAPLENLNGKGRQVLQYVRERDGHPGQLFAPLLAGIRLGINPRYFEE